MQLSFVIMQEVTASHPVKMTVEAQFSANSDLGEIKAELKCPYQLRYSFQLYGAHHSVVLSRISPGWQSRASQILSNVSNRKPLTFPFFNRDMFVRLMPTFSDNSVTLIFFFASIISMLTIIIIYYRCLPLFLLLLSDSGMQNN